MISIKNLRLLWLTGILSLYIQAPYAAAASINVVDDAGLTVTVQRPARRIVTLAPSAAEIAYAAGAGNQIVATVEYSDYPEAAKQLPRVGGYSQLNIEAIVAANPDLVIAWESGNSPSAIAKLRQLNIPVYLSQPNKLADITSNIQRIGLLAGTADDAQKSVREFEKNYTTLSRTYAKRSPVRLFYQISPNPLLTIGGQQIITDAIRLCGGVNIFANLKPMAPRVSFESVIAENPEAIMTSGMQELRPELLDAWKKWPNLTATKRNNLFFIESDLINRGGPRILEGTKILCESLQIARDRRIQAP